MLGTYLQIVGKIFKKPLQLKPSRQHTYILYNIYVYLLFIYYIFIICVLNIYIIMYIYYTSIFRAHSTFQMSITGYN